MRGMKPFMHWSAGTIRIHVLLKSGVTSPSFYKAGEAGTQVPGLANKLCALMVLQCESCIGSWKCPLWLQNSGYIFLLLACLALGMQALDDPSTCHMFGSLLHGVTSTPALAS